MRQKLDRFFMITERGSSIRNELIGGFTTFFAVAYIVVTNPNQITGFTTDGDMGVIWNAVYVASILAAVFGTLMYAFYAKLPYVQACGMGLNSFFCASFILPAAVGKEINGYKEGLCIIFLSGVVFLILSITGARKYIAQSLPDCLKKAIPAGIGLFIAFIGLQNKEVGLIQPNPYTLVQLFDFRAAVEGKSFFDAWCSVAPVVLTLLGLLLIAVLEWKRVKGSVMIVMAGITVAYYLSTWQLPSFDMSQVGQSFVDFADVGLFGAFEGFGVFSGDFGSVLNALMLVLTFCLVDMFDTIGTLYATGEQTGFMDKNGDPLYLSKSMNCDSAATLAGSLFGTSTCTTVVESSAGIAAGARTGLASLVTAGCFFVCLFLTPLASVVPACATAPALIYVGALMLKNFAKVNMNDISEAVPAFLALIMMPLTYSISNGIAIGAIAYIVIALLRGKYTKKDIVLTIVAILFIIRFFTVSI